MEPIYCEKITNLIWGDKWHITQKYKLCIYENYRNFQIQEKEITNL